MMDIGSASPSIMTVQGPIPLDRVGAADAHNHLWIDVVPGASPGAPHLDDWESITSELVEYRQAGGATILDCQPGGCGRNGARLYELSLSSGVNVIACTGFHRQHYYAYDYWLWKQNAANAAKYFIDELNEGLQEARGLPQLVRPGFIKIACDATLPKSPQAALEGAAMAASMTGAAIVIHTEKGSDAEAIVRYFLDRGLTARQLVICHIDKYPDFGLHNTLAQTGVLLEYDTFYRARYAPEENLWPLIDQMMAAGLASSVALGTDMAEVGMWRRLGGGPGLAGFLTIIRPALQARGFSPAIIDSLLGGNIARHLAI